MDVETATELLTNGRGRVTRGTRGSRGGNPTAGDVTRGNTERGIERGSVGSPNDGEPDGDKSTIAIVGTSPTGNISRANLDIKPLIVNPGRIGDNGGRVGNGTNDGGNVSGDAKRGRGRPAGSRNRTTGTIVQDIPIGPITAEPAAKTPRGRRPKAESVTHEACETLVEIGFGILTILRGQHWSITSEQSAAIADPLQKILLRQSVRNPKRFERMAEILEYTELGINIFAVAKPAIEAERAIINDKKSFPHKPASASSVAVPTASDGGSQSTANGTGRVKSGGWGNLNKID